MKTQLLCTFTTKGELQNTLQQIREILPGMMYHEFTDKGHFCEDDLGTKEFPKLLEIILK